VDLEAGRKQSRRVARQCLLGVASEQAIGQQQKTATAAGAYYVVCRRRSDHGTELAQPLGKAGQRDAHGPAEPYETISRFLFRRSKRRRCSSFAQTGRNRLATSVNLPVTPRQSHL
jgi:hypothetical protein